MKIFAVGMNYPQHNKEVQNTLLQKTASADSSRDPIIFTKADSALLKDHKPFFLPDFMGQIDYETELVVRICRLGKSIPEQFAHRYYDAVTVGIDFTARDMQRELRALGDSERLRRLCRHRRVDRQKPAATYTSHTLLGRDKREDSAGGMLFRDDTQCRPPHKLYLTILHAEDRRHPVYRHSGWCRPRKHQRPYHWIHGRTQGA